MQWTLKHFALANANKNCFVSNNSRIYLVQKKTSSDIVLEMLQTNIVILLLEVFLFSKTFIFILISTFRNFAANTSLKRQAVLAARNNVLE